MDKHSARIGIDRTVIAAFRIKAIDRKKLREHFNVEFHEEDPYGYLLEDCSCFDSIKIEDNIKFGTMCAGVKRVKGVKQSYSRMDIVVDDREDGNFRNMTVEEYKERISNVFHYLKETYGVDVDISSIKLSEMEINCTIPMNEEFYHYHRALRLLMFNLPKNYKKLGEVSEINKEKSSLEAETFYCGNSREEIKIYDKTRQLEQTKNIKLDSNYMRVEITLKGLAKIKEVFKSSLVRDLTDEKIRSYYMKEIKRFFESPYAKWKKHNNTELRKLVKAHREADPKNWKVNLLRECSNREQKNRVPVLLDIDDLLVLIKKLEKNGHYARVARGVKKACCFNDVYLSGDSRKVEEIFQKIHEANLYTIRMIRSTTTCGEAA